LVFQLEAGMRDKERSTQPDDPAAVCFGRDAALPRSLRRAMMEVVEWKFFPK
jgi:hypothetical protein